MSFGCAHAGQMVNGCYARCGRPLMAGGFELSCQVPAEIGWERLIPPYEAVRGQLCNIALRNPRSYRKQLRRYYSKSVTGRWDLSRVLTPIGTSRADVITVLVYVEPLRYTVYTTTQRYCIGTINGRSQQIGTLSPG